MPRALRARGAARARHMAWHTVSEAQTLTGKSRRTLYRDSYIIENGERIDLNDSHRRRFRYMELASFPQQEA